MEQNLNEKVLDKLTKVCLCKAISRATIKKAIKEGAKTVEEVKKKTGAGKGGCKGRKCSVKIEELLTQHEMGKF